LTYTVGDTKIFPLGDSNDFGKFLKKLRAKGRLTQQELSKKVGVSWQTVHNWERKNSLPSKTKLQRLADTFQIPLVRFSEIKNRFANERRLRYISECKDPVVSNLEPAFVPLLDKSMKLLPLEAIRHPEKWNGKRCLIPADLFAGNIFGFEISDKKMEPDYRLGDVVIVDRLAPLRDSRPVVIKVKRYPPMCRIYTGKGSTVALVTPNAKDPIVKVRLSDVEWCYTVIPNEEE